MRTRITTTLLTLALLAVPYSLHAQDATRYQQTIAVGGTELLTLHSDDEAELLSRCAILYGRLPWILADAKLEARDVHVRRSGTETMIYVKNRLFVTVMDEDAQANQNTPSLQAGAWRAQLALALPLVRVLH